MLDEDLLSRLNYLLDHQPSFSSYRPLTSEDREWLAKVHALIGEWDKLEAIEFKTSAKSLSSQFNWEYNRESILGALHQVIEALKLKVPNGIPCRVFPPGKVYDFYKALNDIIEESIKEVFIIDPYMNGKVFDEYLKSRPESIAVRMMTSDKCADSLRTSIKKYNEQQAGESNVELRCSKSLHDRVLFIDSQTCWVMGQSIKDAAKKTPTYLLSLPPEVVKDKLSWYDAFWDNSTSDLSD